METNMISQGREKSDLIRAFLSDEGAAPRYVLGKNEHAKVLLDVLDIEGVIDDFAEAGSHWQGKPVLRGEQVPPSAIVVNCSMSISPVSADRRARRLPVSGVLAYSDLSWAAPERIPFPDFVSETQRDFNENGERWRWIAGSLADAASRKVLNDLLRYRLSGDYSVMSGYRVRFDEQYFEPFLGLPERSVFVDAGGFDGDTTEQFCRRYPTYGKVYLFEPSRKTIEKAKTRLADFRDIEFIAKGLSDTAGSLCFNEGAGSASAIDEHGDSRIEVVTLDDAVAGRVSFIKMDLEGWEVPALRGCKRHLIEDHPVLAISVYHHASDFWRIAECVFSIRNDYRLYLRHYTEGWSETVMFFVPES